METPVREINTILPERAHMLVRRVVAVARRGACCPALCHPATVAECQGSAAQCRIRIVACPELTRTPAAPSPIVGGKGCSRQESGVKRQLSALSEWCVTRPEPSIGAENIGKRWATRQELSADLPIHRTSLAICRLYGSPAKKRSIKYAGALPCDGSS